MRSGSSSLRAAGALLSIALASGCLVGPKFAKPAVALNANWSESGNARIATQTPIDKAWWMVFNDPTLNQLVELAYHQNLPLQMAGIRILEARAQLGIAVGMQFPENPGAIISAGGQGLSKNAPNLSYADHFFGNYQVGFDSVWELDFWGKYRRGVRAETANLLATIADYDNALVALTAEVARTYALIRTYEVLIEQARTNVTLEEEAQRIAESRFRNGATAELDVTQATTLLESTRASIPELQVNLQGSRNALCTLLGQPTGCVPLLLAATSGIPSATVPVAVSVPAEMLRRRPDIRRAELKAIAQCERIGVAKADLFPRLVLFGSIGTQSSSGGGAQSNNSSIANLFGPMSLLYSFGIQLFLPLFSYPKIMNNMRVQDARYQEALVDYRNTVLKAAQEVEDGLVGFVREQEAAVFAQNAATSAEASMKLALVQYREGAVDYQRVLDSQRTLLQSQDSFARTRSSAATNLIALYKALGGGWELREGQPMVPDYIRDEMQKRTNWGKYFSKPVDQKKPK